ncbi:EthD domain-containing protein [Cladophialophora immunda]|nr:EthD domain-containing protein [Cladophialophora immunda]
MSFGPGVKQIVAIRRKPNLTRKEYLDYHFRIHGAITDGTENKDDKPHKYIQTHVFDSVFGPRQGGPVNANQPWHGRDDTTEIYFRDWEHVLRCFTSDHVKDKVGPDGANFADYEANIVLMAREKDVHVPTRLASRRENTGVDEADATVALYFISFDLSSYFGGQGMPRYCLVYKVFLKDRASVPIFRRSQHVFEASAKEHVDLHTCFVLFAQEVLVMDMSKDIRFALDRQPDFPDLPGPTHLKS